MNLRLHKSALVGNAAAIFVLLGVHFGGFDRLVVFAQLVLLGYIILLVIGLFELKYRMGAIDERIRVA